MPSIVPLRAPVRPRVFSAAGGTLLLEDEVQRLLDERVSGGARLIGPGKSTALQHLAAVMVPNDRLVLVENQYIDVADIYNGRLVIFVGSDPLISQPKETLCLAPWDRDALIEYLLVEHHEQCASVMARITAEDGSWLRGNPGLWRLVLDELAADPAIPDARTALTRRLDVLLADEHIRRNVVAACVSLIDCADSDAVFLQLRQSGVPNALVRLVRHHAVHRMLSAEQISRDLISGADLDHLNRRLPLEVVRLVAAPLASVPEAVERLKQTASKHAAHRAMSASLLNAAGVKWVPQWPLPIVLREAQLSGVAWPGVNLKLAFLERADLSRADLQGAMLDECQAAHVKLNHAKLCGASLRKFRGLSADLRDANFREACAESANLVRSDLEGAIFDGASLEHASLTAANLLDASFRDSNLSHAFLQGAKLDGADFTGANLERVRGLSGRVLRSACFVRARLQFAQLPDCDLEEGEFAGADLGHANLHGAYLTGASMAGANLERASLRNTGLADVDWEGACLRYADLRGATFHMGSSRSGLVFSPFASEGSRTGFYTDEYGEQDYKSPEEIRKANLCNADLRGANIEGVDFYLVDLRGAIYTDQQADWFHRCGAILKDRCEAED